MSTGTDEQGDFLISISDIRKSGHCSRGAKNFFETNGLDFRHFLKNGILASELSATGDAQAKQVVDRTRERRYGKRK